MAFINFHAPIKDFHGRQLTVSASADEDAAKLYATLAIICIEALLQPLRDDHPTGQEKFQRFELARRIHNQTGPDWSQEGIEVSAEEVSLLKRLVAIAWPTTIQGPAWELLDPKST